MFTAEGPSENGIINQRAHRLMVAISGKSSPKARRQATRHLSYDR
jgi:hypothetical protein